METLRRRERLRNEQLRDLGHCNESCFTPFETSTSHHQPHNRRNMIVNSEVFTNDKHGWMINKMINIIRDPPELENMLQMGLIRSRNGGTRNGQSTFFVR